MNEIHNVNKSEGKKKEPEQWNQWTCKYLQENFPEEDVLELYVCQFFKVFVSVSHVVSIHLFYFGAAERDCRLESTNLPESKRPGG